MDKERLFIDKEIFISILSLIGSIIILANGLILLPSRICNLIGSLILALTTIGIYSYVLLCRTEKKKTKTNIIDKGVNNN